MIGPQTCLSGRLPAAAWQATVTAIGSSSASGQSVDGYTPKVSCAAFFWASSAAVSTVLLLLLLLL
jgi:hypothetical protein